MKIIGTTILSVRKDGKVAIGGDGQVTMGQTVCKHQAKKIRSLANGKVLVGFAGAVGDAFALLERFDEKLKSEP
ncbi:MAG: HslU--HslV peptidase proteolytic subunit, partial [Planctomycetota bacterium]